MCRSQYQFLKKVLLYSTVAWTLRCAAYGFIIKGVKFEGLSRVTLGQALLPLPPVEGETFTTRLGQDILHLLHEGGQFSSISLLREGDMLCIRCVEKPVIASVECEIMGSFPLDKEKLLLMVAERGVASGDAADAYSLSLVEGLFKQACQELGYHAANVQVMQVPLSNQRVLIKVLCYLGLSARVVQVNFVGNHAVPSWKLEQSIALDQSLGIEAMISAVCEYFQSPRLDLSAFNSQRRALMSFYKSLGYLEAAIKDCRVQLNPEKTGIYITYYLYEGPKYLLEKVECFCKNPKLEPLLLQHLKDLELGVGYNAERAEEHCQLLQEALSGLGYYGARVNKEELSDPDTHQVTLRFMCYPKQLCYVRYITFSGVDLTQEGVLRRMLLQKEGALFNGEEVHEDNRMLSTLGFLGKTTCKVKPVSNRENLVDIEYEGDYRSRTGEAGSLSASFSGLHHIEVEAGWAENNVGGMGVGGSISLGLRYQIKENQTAAEQKKRPWTGHFRGGLEHPTFFNAKVGGALNVYYHVTQAQPGGFKDNTTSLPFVSCGMEELGGRLSLRLWKRCKASVSAGADLPHIFYHETLRTEEGEKIPTCYAGDPETGINEDAKNKVKQIYDLRLASSFYYGGLNRALYPSSGCTLSLKGEAFVRDQLCKLEGEYNFCYAWDAKQRWRMHLGLKVVGGFAFKKEGYPFYRKFLLHDLRGFEDGALGPRACFSSDASEIDEQDEKRVRRPAGGRYLGKAVLEQDLPFPFIVSPLWKAQIFCELGYLSNTVSFTELWKKHELSLGVAGKFHMYPFGFICVSVACAPFTTLSPSHFSLKLSTSEHSIVF